MGCLVIHQGVRDTKLADNGEINFLYRIGPGQVSGREFISLNCEDELYEEALRLRDPYAEWVYTLNEEFSSRSLIRDELSLFFLTDLSNKRNELFDTYETIANLSYLKKRLQGKGIEKIELYGTDAAFFESLCSVFPNTQIVRFKRSRERVSLGRRVLADLFYVLRVVIAVFLNGLDNTEKPSTKGRDKSKYFFSFFPQMFDSQLSELRYRDMVKPQDAYLVTILADGMHQNVPITSYRRLVKSLSRYKFELIDRQLHIRDVPEALRRYWGIYKLARSAGKLRFEFQEINLSRFIRQELLWSASRIGRLTFMEKALDRTLASVRAKEIVYPNFEYAFGRMISALVGMKYKSIVRTGFNHGDYSWRFVNYFLAKKEAKITPPYLNHCPIPDRVLAEDELCSEIYKYNGYCNVTIMDEVTRLDYLENLKPKKCDNFALIAAGLHDGELLAACLKKVVETSPTVRFLFKPHPRAKNAYLKKLPQLPNLEVVASPINQLLEFVGRVYVTYSGVGVEAARLGIPTTLVHMPGRISWSKLLDYPSEDPE